MEKQTRNKTIRKTYDITPEFWVEVENEIKLTNENFTVHVTRLLRENLEKRNKRDS